MKWFRSPLAAVCLGLFALHLSPAPDSTALVTLLRDFLEGAGRNDAAMHQRFWADDLVYTGSGGRRTTKDAILKEVREAPAPKPGDPVTRYTAEDVQVRQYDLQTAMIAFRLVATTNSADSVSVSNYLNTGFFRKRGGVWQVVGWQATRKP